MNLRKRKGGRNVTVHTKNGNILMNVIPINNTQFLKSYKIKNKVYKIIPTYNHTQTTKSILEQNISINKDNFNTNLRQTINAKYPKKVVSVTTQNGKKWYTVFKNTIPTLSENKKNDIKQIINTLQKYTDIIFELNNKFTNIQTNTNTNTYTEKLYKNKLSDINSLLTNIHRLLTSITHELNHDRLKMTLLNVYFNSIVADLSRLYNQIVLAQKKIEGKSIIIKSYIKEINELFIEDKILDQITSMQKSITSL